MSGLQWFVAVDGLKGPAIEAARDGRITFWPARWQRAYVGWLERLRDWNISRQLWWGHRIPAWYCPDGHVTVAVEDPAACAECGTTELEQDPDVLDTWFSSQLWPFSTLGWPDDTPELRAFYPNRVLVTGYEILYLWVARMIMSGMSLAGDIPFRDVVIHGLVRDAHGRKMSKSLGNVIDPIEMIDEYGADALRFSLARLATGGQQDIPLAIEAIEGGRRFANKIWNAARLVLQSFPGGEPVLPSPERLKAPQRWVLARHQRCVREVNEALDRYEFATATQTLYRFIWSEYSDWGLEMEKERLRSEDEQERGEAANVLAWILERTLRLLHPVMPFVTEEIWQRFGIGDTIVTAPWPEVDKQRALEDLGADTEAAWPFVEELVTTVRRFRSEQGIPRKSELALLLAETTGDRLLFDAVLGEFRQEVVRLAGLSGIERASGESIAGAARLVVRGETVWIPVGDLIDLDAERERLHKRLAEAEQDLERAERKLANEGFRAKAPEDVVLAEKLKVERFEREAASVREQLAELG
jgi:valyl-tRNA synthetase